MPPIKCAAAVRCGPVQQRPGSSSVAGGPTKLGPVRAAGDPGRLPNEASNHEDWPAAAAGGPEPSSARNASPQNSLCCERAPLRIGHPVLTSAESPKAHRGSALQQEVIVWPRGGAAAPPLVTRRVDAGVRSNDLPGRGGPSGHAWGPHGESVASLLTKNTCKSQSRSVHASDIPEQQPAAAIRGPGAPSAP